MNKVEFNRIVKKYQDFGHISRYSTKPKKEEVVEKERAEVEELVKESLKSYGGPVGWGLIIQAKYADNQFFIQAEHDVIWGVYIYAALERGITEEEVILLHKLGWREDDELGHFRIFV